MTFTLCGRLKEEKLHTQNTGISEQVFVRYYQDYAEHSLPHTVGVLMRLGDVLSGILALLIQTALWQ